MVPQDKWRRILKQLDYCAKELFCVTPNLYGHKKGDDIGNTVTKLVNKSRQRQQAGIRAPIIDLQILAEKTDLTDFLRILSKEKVLREILSEYNLNHHSIK